jgi:signal transduction histidine kinase
LKNIFEPWYRESKDRHGLGLGLAIVQSTTFALGGKISIQSALGVGTQITLTLPPKKKK